MNSRAYNEACDVVEAAWRRWDIQHPGSARSAPIAVTLCVCGHSATDHDDTGCRRYISVDPAARAMACPCERYHRAIL